MTLISPSEKIKIAISLIILSFVIINIVISFKITGVTKYDSSYDGCYIFKDENKINHTIILKNKYISHGNVVVKFNIYNDKIGYALLPEGRLMSSNYGEIIMVSGSPRLIRIDQNRLSFPSDSKSNIYYRKESCSS